MPSPASLFYCKNLYCTEFVGADASVRPPGFVLHLLLAVSLRSQCAHWLWQSASYILHSPPYKKTEANASVLSVPKKYFYHAAQVFETLKKFQKLLILMVRDTLLGFPSHALPYRYRNSYHFIDRPPLSFTFSHHCQRTYPPRIYKCGCARRTTRGYPLLSCPYRRISPELGRPAHRLAAGRASGRTYAPKGS